MAATMQAAVISEHGGPEAMNVGPADRPVPGPDEIIVRVGACGVSHLDIFVRRGMPGVTIPLPHIAGGDVTGWVEELGADVTDIEPGAAVLIDPTVPEGTLGEGRAGGLAEYVAVPAANAIPLAGDAPERLVAVAALPIAYGTAQRMLFDRGRLSAGETVVVLGASGGVGVACLQLAKRAGATVIAITSSDAKADRLRALGADTAVVAADGKFGKQVWEATGKQGADMVVDFTGEATWPQSLRCVKPHGRLVTCGATTGYDAATDLRYVWVREIDIRGSDGWTRDGLLELVGLVEGGELDPVIHAIYPLSRAGGALEEMEERRAFGKVVVMPDDVFESFDHPAKR